MIYILIEILIVGAVIAIDLTTKSAAFSYLQDKPFRQSDFIKGFMDFKYTENTGAGWGIFQEKTIALTIFTAIALALLLALIILRAKKDRKLIRIPLLLIFAGGVGNLVDRIMFGYVRDFLRFTFINFPIFNLADTAITVGAILLVIALIVDMIEDGKKLKVQMAENTEHYLKENHLTIKDGKISEIVETNNTDENAQDTDESTQDTVESAQEDSAVRTSLDTDVEYKESDTKTSAKAKKPKASESAKEQDKALQKLNARHKAETSESGKEQGTIVAPASPKSKKNSNTKN